MQLPRPLVVFDQLPGDPVGDIRTRPPELAALALLRRRPDDVALLIHQAHGGDGFMLALLDVAGFVLADTKPGVRALAVPRPPIAARPAVGAGLHPLAPRT